MHLEIFKADGAIAFDGAASLIPGCISCCSCFCTFIQIILMDQDDSRLPEAICGLICKSSAAGMRHAMLTNLTNEAGMLPGQAFIDFMPRALMFWKPTSKHCRKLWHSFHHLLDRLSMSSWIELTLDPFDA